MSYRDTMLDEDLQAAVRRLRRQKRDDGTVEAKSCAAGLGNSVWESVSAFANTAGGLLLLGLAEETGFKPAEGFDANRAVDQFISGIGDGGDVGKLVNPPEYVIHRIEVDGIGIVGIEFRENSVGNKPCYVAAKGISNGSYKRIDDKDIRLSSTEIFELQQQLVPQRSDRSAVPGASVVDFDPNAVGQLLSLKQGSKALAGVAGQPGQLVRLNALAAGGDATLAGILTLGSYPQQFEPRLLIDVAVHPANEKSTAGSIRFLDRVICEGAIDEMIDQAVSAVARNLRTYSVIEGTVRRDEIEIPVAVLREAIANATVHREYSELFRGQSVAVDVFPNRVEVASPGGLWGGKTLDNIDDGTSVARNPTLIRLLQAGARGTGFRIEGQGGGVPLMIHEMQAHALDRPVFRASADRVTVVLRRHGAEIPRVRDWLHGLTERPLDAHEDAALVIVWRGGSTNAQQLREALGVDSDEARKILARLAARGLLESLASGAYRLAGGENRLRKADAELLSLLSAEFPMSIQDLSLRAGKTPNALRPILRRLVNSGLAAPTAPPGSKARKYVRVTADGTSSVR